MKTSTKKIIEIFALVIAIFFSGCMSITSKTYSGPKKDIRELAILLRENAIIRQIDEKEFAQLYEYHLLPGKHLVKCIFIKHITSKRYIYSAPFDIHYTFKAGYVYTARGVDISEEKCKVEIICNGTIKEIAPILAERREAPNHWKKLTNSLWPDNERH